MTILHSCKSTHPLNVNPMGQFFYVSCLYFNLFISVHWITVVYFCKDLFLIFLILYEVFFKMRIFFFYLKTSFKNDSIPIKKRKKKSLIKKVNNDNFRDQSQLFNPSPHIWKTNYSITLTPKEQVTSIDAA